MPLDVPGLRHVFEQADHDLAGFFADVGAAARIAQDRQLRVHAGDGLRDQVVVLRGLQRDVDARQPTDLARPHAGAIDDDLVAMRPRSVCTAVTRPPSRSIAVTGHLSNMRTPARRAPLASACVTSVGLTRPSLESGRRPERHRRMPAATAAAPRRRSISSHSIPQLCAARKPRRISSALAGVSASWIDPHSIRPVACPVSDSSLR